MKINQKIIVYSLSVFLVATGIVYLMVAYDEYSDFKELSDMGIKGETTEKQFEMAFFTVSAIIYFGLCAWVVRSGETQRLPHYITIVISVALILAYLASRTVGVPVVGIDYYVGRLDIITKILQVIVIGLSVFAIYNMKRHMVKNTKQFGQ